LSARMDELEARIGELREEEDLSRLRPALDGGAVMALLDIGPSRAVGQALDFLMEIRLDEGEIDVSEAQRRLLSWWADRGAH
jgi:poly(A) polymerase